MPAPPADFELGGPDEAEEGAELIAKLQQASGAQCRSCGKPLCPHELLAGMALGLQTAPRCLECTAGRLQQPVEQVTDCLLKYFSARSCYREAWNWAATRMNEGRACCGLYHRCSGRV